mgnify:CR=1 FL=1
MPVTNGPRRLGLLVARVGGGVALAKAKLAKQRLHAEVSRYTGGLTSILRATKVTKLFESTSVAQQQKKTLMQTTVMDEGEEGLFIDDRLPLQAQSGAAHVLAVVLIKIVPRMVATLSFLLT